MFHPHSDSSDDIASLVHQNAILGCKSWEKWPEVTFSLSSKLTWYHCSVRDILFNSVLDADYNIETFTNSLSEINQFSESTKTPIAWLVARPTVLTEKHRASFEGLGFKECNGTTGMYLDLTDKTHRPLLEHHHTDQADDMLSLSKITTDRELALWARMLFTVYNFPPELAPEWYNMHLAIGYGDKAPWQHYLLREGDNPIGTASIYLGPDVNHSSFANLAILPDYRGKGLGSYVTKRALSDLADTGYHYVTLYAAQSAVALYNRLGFTQTGKNTFFVKQ